MADAKGGVSMLDKLAGNIVETKSAAGSKLSPALTPVSGERPAGLPQTPAVFPYDYPDQLLTQTIDTLIRERDTLDGIIRALKLLHGDPEVVAAEIAEDKRVTQHALEIEADRRAADVKKAEAGDKKAAERVRVHVEKPIPELAAAAETRDAKRAAVLAAMMDAPDDVTAMSAAGEVAAETFDARLTRLGDEAKAAAFTQPVKAEPAVTGTGWTCPQHGDTMIAVKVSPRRGVQFRKCAVADCHEFEKV